MKLVLDVNRAPHLEHFIKFLESRTKTNETINLDEWTTFLQFNYMVNVSLSDYPEDNAFPILFEEYVTWRQSGPGKCVS
jgi:DCN1-like protein 3